MRRKKIGTAYVALAALPVALLTGSATTLAQTGGGYDLTWSTIDGGGGSSGGGYTLSGSIGQPDATVLSGGGFTLTGGFWSGAAPSYRLFLPLVVKG